MEAVPAPCSCEGTDSSARVCSFVSIWHIPMASMLPVSCDEVSEMIALSGPDRRYFERRTGVL